MRNGFAFSVGFHVLVLAILILGLPFFHPKVREAEPMITVDVIDISKQPTTNKISAANKVEKVPKEETPTPPKPQPAPQPVAADLPQVDSVAETQPEIEVPDVTLKKPTPQKIPDIADVSPKVAEIAPPKVELKKAQPKPPPPDFNAVLKNLVKQKPQETTPNPTPSPSKAPPQAATGALALLSDKLSNSEMGALQRQLAQCWNIPAGAKDAQNLAVDLDVEVGPDRVVTKVAIVDQGRLGSDPIYRAAAMSAQRALRMPQCTPLELPADKYDEWKSMTLHFDPKEMLGQ